MAGWTRPYCARPHCDVCGGLGETMLLAKSIRDLEEYARTQERNRLAEIAAIESFVYEFFSSWAEYLEVA